MEVALDLVSRIDDIGRPAWIALMVVGFIIFWPVGLAILGYLLWSGRMGMNCGRGSGFWKRGRATSGAGGWTNRQPSSGNSAFDEYRADTLRRLEEEQREFFDFLERLRHAKDKAEFDQFMADRRSRNGGPGNPAPQAG
jgi:hypothetical protein